MKPRRTTLAALIAAGGAAAVIAAPTALAQPNCDQTDPGLGGQSADNSSCQSPGNAEINDRLPDTNLPSFGGSERGI
ncbi:MAG: hypothetical protein SW019_17990 [Actinomycetota bacterium]|nr:hypothetical protein [Actinomycetota bacterium]